MSKNNIISFFPTLEPRVYKGTDLFPVSIIVYHNGKRKRYRLGIQLSKEQWDKLRTPKLRDENLKEIKKAIQEYIEKAEVVKKNIEKEKLEFNFDEFETRYFNKINIDNAEITFTDCVKIYIDNYKKDHQGKELSIKSILMYETFKNSLLRYKKNLKINQITPNLLNDYKDYLEKGNKSVSTIGVYLRQLRAIMNFAVLKGYIQSNKYPFKGYNVPTAENNKRALNNDELKALINFSTTNEHERKAIDYWIFSYLGNGINFNDIARLKFNNIQGEFIHFVRAKTKNKQKIEREINIFLLPQMNEIITRYCNDRKNNSDYIFPIIDNTMNPLQQYKTIAQYIKTTNKYLKRISSTLNFDFPLTTYFARHSWATKMRNSGVSISYISEGLGHSKIATTENYLSKFPEKEAKEYANKLMEFNT